jgi:hypothetical protein
MQLPAHRVVQGVGARVAPVPPSLRVSLGLFAGQPQGDPLHRC